MSGDADKVTGKAKELGGKVSGDKDLEAEGKGEHAKGKVKKAVEDVKDAARGAIDSVKPKRKR